MKKWLFIFLLLPLFSSAQFDFNTRYFSIDAESLPELEDLLTISFNSKPLVKRTLNEFQMNVENYRTQVDMAIVVNTEGDYVQRPYNIEPINAQLYGFGDNARYTADGSTKVKNIVYKDMRGLELVGSCPPFGICQRCAPYRVGRGY